jgi:hypothetical protein
MTDWKDRRVILFNVQRNLFKTENSFDGNVLCFRGHWNIKISVKLPLTDENVQDEKWNKEVNLTENSLLEYVL